MGPQKLEQDIIHRVQPLKGDVNERQHPTSHRDSNQCRDLDKVAVLTPALQLLPVATDNLQTLHAVVGSGSTTKVMEDILGSTQKDAQKRGKCHLALWVVVCIRLRGFGWPCGRALVLDAVAWSCCRVSSSGPVVLGFVLSLVFFLVSGHERRPKDRSAKAGTPELPVKGIPAIVTPDDQVASAGLLPWTICLAVAFASPVIAIVSYRSSSSFSRLPFRNTEGNGHFRALYVRGARRTSDPVARHHEHN